MLPGQNLLETWPGIVVDLVPLEELYMPSDHVYHVLGSETKQYCNLKILTQ